MAGVGRLFMDPQDGMGELLDWLNMANGGLTN
jgi:hypothetical protein